MANTVEGPAWPPADHFFRCPKLQPEMVMILIVEDDIDLAQACSMLLESSGYEVQVAHDAEEALSKIRENKPDLLISDCIMHGCTGLELSQQLRELYSRSALPILLMSGSLRSQVGCGDSFDAFISKPFLAESLLMQVKNLLNEGDAVSLKTMRSGK